jgi:phytochromobilin:ferredoxin oxidoreductase
MEEAVREVDKETIDRNKEAQHRYLTWRAEKVRPSLPIHQ